MAAIDPSQFSSLSKFFPELTELQAIHVCLLVFGQLSISELAEIRGICPSTVKESMNGAQKKLGVNSMKLLRTVVVNRILIQIAIHLFNKN